LMPEFDEDELLLLLLLRFSPGVNLVISTWVQPATPQVQGGRQYGIEMGILTWP
jgi:hypothetical protein